METGVLPYIICTVAILKGANVKAILKLLAYGSTQLKRHGVNSWKNHLQKEKR